MPSYRVPAVDATARILNHLATAAAEGSTQAQLARALGLSKSTAHTLLATLEELGWVERDHGRRYHLGPELIGLGAVAARRVSVIALAVRHIVDLADEWQLTLTVARPVGDATCQVVERAYPSSEDHVGVTIGTRYGLFDGAIGRAMLALMEPGRSRALIEASELPRHTPRTIVDPARLIREVALVRRRCWATAVRDLNDNHAVVGFSPSRDPAQQTFLICYGFPSQLPRPRMSVIGPRLAATATDVNRQAGLLAS